MPTSCPAAPTYQRRRPENTVFYQTIRGHLETFSAQTAGDDTGTPGLCDFIRREFEAYFRLGTAYGLVQRRSMPAAAAGGKGEPTLMSQIAGEEIQYLPSFQIDSSGRAFLWREGIFRSVRPEHATFFRSVLSFPAVRQLQDEGRLVRTTLTPYLTGDAALVLEHERVPFVSICPEWPAPMLRDAARTTLLICRALASDGLTLKDAHPWNVLFRGTQPVFVDFGSIEQVAPNTLWSAYGQFCNFFLFPLYFHAAGHHKLARCLLRDPIHGVTESDVIRFSPLSQKLRHPRRFFRVAAPAALLRAVNFLLPDVETRIRSFSARLHSRLASDRTRLRFFDMLLEEVEAIDVTKGSSYWSRYYSRGLPPGARVSDPDAARDWQRKKEAVESVLRQVQPASALDLGANTGDYARLAAELAGRAIACDSDEGSVRQCWAMAQGCGTEILPLVLDVLNPTPPYGTTPPMPPASDRLKCDLTLALALLHHLVIQPMQTLASAVACIRAFSTSTLLIEYVPEDHAPPHHASLLRSKGYSDAGLLAVLQSSFRRVSAVPSHPPGRVLFLCQQ